MKNRLTLDRSNAKLMGVCAGLAKWTDIDVSMIRLIWVIAVLLGIGAPILIYLALGLILD